MKRLLLKPLLLGITIATCHFGHSQSVYVGAKAGGALPALENFDFANGDGYDAFGYHGGIMGGLKLKGLGLHLEGLYAVDQFEGMEIGTTNKRTYTRILFPVLIRLQLAEGLNFEVGPQFGYLLEAESEITASESIVLDITETTNGGDLAAAIGMSYSTPFGLELGARYSFGLSDFPNAGQNISGVQVWLGYELWRKALKDGGIPQVKRRKWKGN